MNKIIKSLAIPRDFIIFNNIYVKIYIWKNY